MMMQFYLILLFLLSLMFILMNLLISKKKFKNREKNSPFECGFDSMSSTRIPFSIQFFIISLMFLIFDIEISILIPLIYFSYKLNNFVIYTSYIFLLILIYSIYFEFLENMMEWKK